MNCFESNKTSLLNKIISRKNFEKLTRVSIILSMRLKRELTLRYLVSYSFSKWPIEKLLHDIGCSFYSLNLEQFNSYFTSLNSSETHSFFKYKKTQNLIIFLSKTDSIPRKNNKICGNHAIKSSKNKLMRIKDLEYDVLKRKHE